MFGRLKIALDDDANPLGYEPVPPRGGGPQGMPTAFGGPSCGIIAGTLVASALGWRPVEAIAQGEKVITLDEGLQPVVRVERSPLWNANTPVPRSLWPLAVPMQAIGNSCDLRLLPEEMVVLESDAADDLYGDPFVMLPAAALQGFWGIARQRPVAPLQVASLYFDRGQVVAMRSGALVRCAAACAVREAMEGAVPPYRTLGQAEAVWLFDLMRERSERPDGASAVQAIQAAWGI